jgi:hypothetical protein
MSQLLHNDQRHTPGGQRLEDASICPSISVLKTTPNDGSQWTLYLQGYLRDQESLVLLEKARNSLQRKGKSLPSQKAMRDRIQI